MQTDKSKIHFKKASYSDVGFLTYLRKVTMDEHLFKAGIKMSDEQHTSRVFEFFEESFLIQVNGHTVGVIKLGIENAALHIRQFQILPNYQNHGIGKSVLEVCKKKAREKGISLTLNVLLENPAKDLYLKNGFEIETTDKLQHFMRCSLL
ncbi:GNAT family N-acetyltransferase [Thalassotalea algicola]|nr:GNAT family N-acetyltransferase [Thalassotalea algicola]